MFYIFKCFHYSVNMLSMFVNSVRPDDDVVDVDVTKFAYVFT